MSRQRLLTALVVLVVLGVLAGLVSLMSAAWRPTASEGVGALPASSAAPPLPAPVLPPMPALPPVPLPVPVVPLPTAVPVPPTSVRPPLPLPPVVSCLAPPGRRMRDLDASDPLDPAWPRVRTGEVVVSFATAGLPRRYANAVVLATRIWSQSPCVQAVAVARCPARGHCSTVVLSSGSGGADVDGNSEATWSDDARTENAITLYTALLGRSSDNAVLGTVVHEMGHALGLSHRNDPRDIMSAVTGDDTSPRPDATDFANLAVLYGR